MRIKCITGTFDDDAIYVEITDSSQESIGEMITPSDYNWVEEQYPGATEKVKSKLFYYSSDEGFFHIEEKHPLFNIDLVCEWINTDDPIERQLYLSVTKLLRPYIDDKL